MERKGGSPNRARGNSRMGTSLLSPGVQVLKTLAKRETI